MEVRENIQVGPEIYRMDLTTSEKMIEGKPGQFIHIKVGRDGLDPLLRRPFSIFSIDQNKLSILYKVCGKGTEILSRYKRGEKLDILGPLGHGFNIDQRNKDIILLGGGMGIAPLFYLARRLEKENNLKVILGAESKYELSYLNAAFFGLDLEIHLATMDGSQGIRETAVDLWNELMKKGIITEKPDYLYSCGPTAMLKKVQKICKNNEIKTEASLEERMGCGVGVCLSCIIRTVNGNMRACKEGPVFPLDEVIFDEK